MKNSHRIIHVFVSSTFNDMQSERDAIMKIVIPQANKKLSSYGIKIIPADLRWGIDTHKYDENESEAKVLHICIDTLKSCRPYFIGLIGERYGWIPTEERMEAIYETLNEEDRAIINVMGRGFSVTELEIMLGVMGTKSYVPHSFFLFRDIDSYEGMDTVKKAQYIDGLKLNNADCQESATKLSKLKKKIRDFEKYSDTCETHTYKSHWDSQNNRFDDLGDFSDWLTNALVRDILNDIDLNNDVNFPLEAEYVAQETFRFNLRFNFNGREEILLKLEQFVRDFYDGKRPTFCHHGLILEGDSGSGKSSIYTKLYENLTNSGYNVIGFSAGVTENARSKDTFTDFIGYLLGVEPTPKEITKRLLNAQLEGYKPVFLLDSLDSLNNIYFGAYDILKFIPQSVPFIFTTTPGVVGVDIELDNDVYSIIKLDDYTREEAEALVNDIFGTYHKELSPDLVEKLLDKVTDDGIPAYHSPIWVRMAANILLELGDKDFHIIHDRFEDAEDAKIQAYLTQIVNDIPSTIQGLFRYTLETACSYFNPEIAMKSLIFIALSSDGISESTLSGLFGDNWDSLEFNSFANWMNLFVRLNTNGLYELTHNIFKHGIFYNDNPFIESCKNEYSNFIRSNTDNTEILRNCAYHLVYTQDIDLIYDITHSTSSNIKFSFPGKKLREIMLRDSDAFFHLFEKYLKKYTYDWDPWIREVLNVSRKLVNTNYSSFYDRAIEIINNVYLPGIINSFSFDIFDNYISLIYSVLECIVGEFNHTKAEYFEDLLPIIRKVRKDAPIEYYNSYVSVLFSYWADYVIFQHDEIQSCNGDKIKFINLFNEFLDDYENYIHIENAYLSIYMMSKFSSMLSNKKENLLSTSEFIQYSKRIHSIHIYICDHEHIFLSEKEETCKGIIQDYLNRLNNKIETETDLTLRYPEYTATTKVNYYNRAIYHKFTFSKADETIFANKLYSLKGYYPNWYNNISSNFQDISDTIIECRWGNNLECGSSFTKLRRYEDLLIGNLAYCPLFTDSWELILKLLYLYYEKNLFECHENLLNRIKDIFPYVLLNRAGEIEILGVFNHYLYLYGRSSDKSLFDFINMTWDLIVRYYIDRTFYVNEPTHVYPDKTLYVDFKVTGPSIIEKFLKNIKKIFKSQEQPNFLDKLEREFLYFQKRYNDFAFDVNTIIRDSQDTAGNTWQNLYDTEGHMLTQDHTYYKICRFFNEDGLAPARLISGPSTFINREGKQILGKFDSIRQFSEGLAVFGSTEKYGYINTSGDSVINLQFDDAGDFHQGVAWVMVIIDLIDIGRKCNFYFYIDKHGRKVSKLYDYATSFHNDVAYVFVNQKIRKITISDLDL